jgi:hypothetical protein
MNVLETEWWSLALPQEWWAETEEESILIGDRDGVGCIEISTLLKEEGEFDADTLRGIAESEAEHPLEWRAATLGGFSGVGASDLQDGAAIREWYVACGPTLLFITYSCDREHRGLDDAAVDEMLDTLAVRR